MTPRAPLPLSPYMLVKRLCDQLKSAPLSASMHIAPLSHAAENVKDEVIVTVTEPGDPPRRFLFSVTEIGGDKL
jgi:hypothetical protein